MSPPANSIDAMRARCDTQSGCWVMRGYFDASTGYCYAKLCGKTRYAHRVAWELTNGPIPAGMQINHRCDNRRCINPEHLYAGTHADNMRDKVARGRCAKFPGERNPMAKLKDADVAAIRVDQRTQSAIALDYGVSRSLIGFVKRGRRWAHVG